MLRSIKKNDLFEYVCHRGDTKMSCNTCAEQRYNCYKHHWSDTRKPVCLEVTPGGIDQIDPHTNRVVCSYDYRNVEGFVEVSDYQGGFCILYGGFSRLVCIHRVCVCLCLCVCCHALL